jgi:hypothetical protein
MLAGCIAGVQQAILAARLGRNLPEQAMAGAMLSSNGHYFEISSG